MAFVMISLVALWTFNHSCLGFIICIFLALLTFVFIHSRFTGAFNCRLRLGFLFLFLCRIVWSSRIFVILFGYSLLDFTFLLVQCKTLTFCTNSFTFIIFIKTPLALAAEVLLRPSIRSLLYIIIIKVHEVFKCINMRLILDIKHSFPLELHLFLYTLKSVIWKTLIKQLLLICQLLILRRKHVLVNIVVLFTKAYFLHGDRALNVKGSHISLTL